MTGWKDAVEKRLRDLESLIDQTAESSYPSRARLEDGRLRDSLDRVAKSWEVFPIDHSAAMGAAPAAHHTTHENGGSDEISVLGLSGLLADAQTPLAHATSHQAGGVDLIKLDDLGTPDDNTDLNASTTRHGLLPKLPGTGATQYLDGDGNFTAPSGTGAPTTADYLVKTADGTLSAERVVGDSTSVTANWVTAGAVTFERAALTGDVTATANSNATTIANGAVTAAKTSITGTPTGSKFLRDDWSWQTVTAAPSDGDKGDITVSASGATWTIDAGAVTLAKMANLTAGMLIGRQTSGDGVPQAITPGTGLALTTTTLNVSAVPLTALASQSASTIVARTSSGSGSPTACTLGTGLSLPSGVLTISGLTLAQLESITASKLVGRGSSGDGVPVQITLGNGVTISGTTLSVSQGAAIADATGGSTVDAEARTAINAVLARMRAFTPIIST